MCMLCTFYIVVLKQCQAKANRYCLQTTFKGYLKTLSSTKQKTACTFNTMCRLLFVSLFQTTSPSQRFIHYRKRVDFCAVEHGQRAVFFIQSGRFRCSLR